MPIVNHHKIGPEDIALSQGEVEEGLTVITDPHLPRLQSGFELFGNRVGHEVTRLLTDGSPANAVDTGLKLWDKQLRTFVDEDPLKDDYQIFFMGGVLIGHLEETGAERIVT